MKVYQAIPVCDPYHYSGVRTYALMDAVERGTQTASAPAYVKLEDYEELEKKLEKEKSLRLEMGVKNATLNSRWQAVEEANKSLRNQLDGLEFIINSDEKPRFLVLQRVIQEKDLKIQCLEGQLAVAKDEKLKAEQERRETSRRFSSTLASLRSYLLDQSHQAGFIV